MTHGFAVIMTEIFNPDLYYRLMDIPLWEGGREIQTLQDQLRSRLLTNHRERLDARRDCQLSRELREFAWNFEEG